MAQQNFARALELTLAHEGGYVNHEKDPGGATNLGITHKTLAAWRGKPVTKADVKKLTREEAADIYRAQYWNTIKGNDLPPGLDYAVFDYAVNSGASRAIRDLQRVLGVKQDGVIGAITMDAIRKATPVVTINMLCARRLEFLKSLKTWGTFGRGWQRRVDGVKRDAVAMARKTDNGYTPAEQPTPKANPADRSITDIIKEPQAWGPIGGLLSSLGALVSGSGPVQWALAFGVVAFVGVGVWHVIQSRRNEA